VTPHEKLKPALDSGLLAFARELRKNSTDAEQLMWSILRNRRFCNLNFRRQYPVDPYVLDFYCHEMNLAIELDGGQHNTDTARRYDECRSNHLTSRGITVLRFWNHDVLEDIDAVLEAIHIALTAR
jgi:very-short-patch-repair endonuclease